MANKFVQYPYSLEKATNGGYIVRSQVIPGLPQPVAPTQDVYVFATLADLTYWIGFNEQP